MRDLSVARNRAYPVVAKSRRSPAAFWTASLAFLALLLLAGCSAHREIYPELEKLAAAGKYAQAAEVVVKAKDAYGATNEVLWNMDLGVLYTYAGKYELSNQAFERAEKRIDALFTESVSGNIGAFISND